jgi:hypothetical protein
LKLGASQNIFDLSGRSVPCVASHSTRRGWVAAGARKWHAMQLERIVVSAGAFKELPVRLGLA